MNHVYDQQGHKMNIDRLIQDLVLQKVWSPALENELGRLSQGFRGRVKPQDVLDFILHSEIPHDRKIIYANFICDHRPLKAEKFCVRMTIGGDKLDYPDSTASPTASLLETKLLINSVISGHRIHNSKFCSINIRDFS